MDTITHNLTLQQRARERRSLLELDRRLKEERDQQERRDSSRRAFGWALGRVLDLDYDPRNQYPDNGFPGMMAWDSGSDDWVYQQDGLTFQPSPYYTHDTVLLLGVCNTCDGTAHQDIHSLDFLDKVLDSDEDWQCDYCRRKQAEKEENSTVVCVEDEEPPVVAVPPSVERRLLNALNAWVNEIITDRLSDHYAEDHC